MASTNLEVTLTDGGMALTDGLPQNIWTVSVKAPTGKTVTVPASTTAYFVLITDEDSTAVTRSVTFTVGASDTPIVFNATTSTAIGYFNSTATAVTATSGTMYGATFAAVGP